MMIGGEGKMLNPKQKKTLDLYIEYGDMAKASREAGYKNTDSGYKLIRTKEGAEYVDKRMEELQSDTIASAKEVLETLTRMLRREEVEHNVLRNGMVIQTPTSNTNVIRSAELLGKRYRLFGEQVEINGIVPVVLMGEEDLED